MFMLPPHIVSHVACLLLPWTCSRQEQDQARGRPKEEVKKEKGRGSPDQRPSTISAEACWTEHPIHISDGCDYDRDFLGPQQVLQWSCCRKTPFRAGVVVARHFAP